MHAIDNRVSTFRDAGFTNRRTCGYILIEVLVAMTIFAISGGVLMRSLMNAYEATRTLRDITKAVFLTQEMIHDLEIRYTRRANVQLGEFDGYYSQLGSSRFRWHASIDYSKEHDAYIIAVRTTWDDADRGRTRRRGRWRGDNPGGIFLKTMVMTARYNENLASGFGGDMAPKIGKRGSDDSRRGER